MVTLYFSVDCQCVVEREYQRKFNQRWGAAATLLFTAASVPFPSDRLELGRINGFVGFLWLPGSGSSSGHLHREVELT